VVIYYSLTAADYQFNRKIGRWFFGVGVNLDSDRGLFCAGVRRFGCTGFAKRSYGLGWCRTLPLADQQ
jgi:hypothetical protein